METVPPLVEWDNKMHPRFESKYRMVPASILPTGESLKMANYRVAPFWEDTVCPAIMEGKNVLIVAHQNVFRGIIGKLSGMTND